MNLVGRDKRTINERGREGRQAQGNPKIEGQPIDFRNVRLLDLRGCTDPAASNYKSYFVQSDNTRCR
jgi:hypothetical protein